MKIFDAHCDTIRKIAGEECSFGSAGTTQVSLPSMEKGNVRGQVFACWVSSEEHPNREYEAAVKMIESVHSLVEAFDDRLMLVTNTPDFQAALDESRICVFIGLEGAVALQDDLENLLTFFKRGLRVLTIAWSDNAFCGSVFGNGEGLSKKGHSLIELCEELGIIIDVSHASDRAFQDVLTCAKGPFIASHSNCRVVCPNPRNLTDDMIRYLSDRGGVLGINMGSGFLSPSFYNQQKAVHDRFFRIMTSKAQSFNEAMKDVEEEIAGFPRPEINWIVEHVKHAINIGGENCVGFGSDFDGVESTPQQVDGDSSYPYIIHLLDRAGLNSRQIEKVCFDNFARLFYEVLDRSS